MPSKLFGFLKRGGREDQQAPETSGPPCGVFEVYTPQAECIADVVFVHGLTGHCFDTWRSKDASEAWIKTLLPEAVPNVRILTYGYDAGVVGREVSQGTIRNHSRNLIGSLGHLRHKSPGDRPLIFACHSLGGLVVEDAMVLAKGRRDSDHVCAVFYNSIRGIMFFGTPHCGTDLHRAVAVFQNLSHLVAQTNKSLVAVLNRESEVLANLQDEFQTIVQDLLAEKRISITCFAEELPMPGIGLVVPPSSAHIRGALFKNYSIRANHRDMVRFASTHDNGFSFVVGELTEWVGLLQSDQEHRERLLKKAYASYKRFKDGGCTNFRLLQEAIDLYADARRLSKALLIKDNVMIIRAEIGLTECHRELSHVHRYGAKKKLSHVDEAKGFIEHALMLAKQIGNADLTWRAELESAVIRARRAMLVAKTAGPGDLEVQKAVEQARADLESLKDTPEVEQYTGFVEWAELWLSKLPQAI